MFEVYVCNIQHIIRQQQEDKVDAQALKEVIERSRMYDSVIEPSRSSMRPEVHCDSVGLFSPRDMSTNMYPTPRPEASTIYEQSNHDNIVPQSFPESTSMLEQEAQFAYQSQLNVNKRSSMRMSRLSTGQPRISEHPYHLNENKRSSMVISNMDEL